MDFSLSSCITLMATLGINDATGLCGVFQSLFDPRKTIS